MMRVSMLIAPLALASGASAQAPDSVARGPAQLTRDKVLALPTVEAANALLANIASRFVTMTVEKNGDVPVEAAFGTAPRGTGIAGLCEATVLRIRLVREEDAAAPPEVWGYSVNQVYKVVSEVDGPLGPLDPDEEEQARLCAAAGPVLPSPSEGPRAARFFGYRGYGEYWLGIAALQGAIRAAREGSYGPIECTRRELDDCRNPQAELAALDVRNLSYIDVVQAEPHSADFRVYASFVVEPNRTSSFGWQVSLEFNGFPLPVRRPRRATFTYGRTQLFRY